jgi:tetratricopeptide (TPR) repeat protein
LLLLASLYNLGQLSVLEPEKQSFSAIAKNSRQQTPSLDNGVGNADRHASQAKSYLQAEQLAKATHEINIAIKLNQKKADYQKIKAQICEQSHQQKEALAAYDKAIELDADKKPGFKDKMAACKRFGNVSEYFKTRERFLLYESQRERSFLRQVERRRLLELKLGKSRVQK